MGQKQEQVPPKKKEEAVPAANVEKKELTKEEKELKELMEEIDEILEENAEEYVRNYVQRGGE